MIFFAACVIAVIASLNAEMDAAMKSMIVREVREKIHTCADQEKATQADVDLIINENKSPSSHEGKCTLFCLHRFYNVQKEDGSVDIEGTRSSLQAFTELDENGVLLEEAFEKCHSIPQDPDNCQYAANLGDCIVAEARKLGLKEIIIE